MLTLGKFGVYIDGTYSLADKRLECAAWEKLCNINDPQRVTKIGLIWTEFEHSLLIRDDRIRSFSNNSTFRSELLKCGRKDFLTNLKYIFLCSKTHLEVELIEFSRRSVCSCILISEAGCDLIVLVKTGHHQKLLKLLGSLRQGIELTLILSWRNDIVSCTLRWRSCKDRSLELDESHLLHLWSQIRDNLGTEKDIILNLLITKIQVSVLKSYVLPYLLRSLNFKGELGINLT